MMRSAVLGCLLVFSAIACSEDAGPRDTQGDAGRGASGGAAGSGRSGSSGAIGGGGKAGGGAGSAGATSNAGSNATGGSPAAGSGSVAGSSASAGESSGGSAGAASGASNGGSGGVAPSGGRAGSAQTGGSGGKSAPVPVKDLPIIEEMPDPLTMNDGTKVTTPEQWRTRREEMIRILEDYTYGHMPPPPGNVKATVATETRRVTVSGMEADYRMLHLSFGPEEELGFDLGLFTPVTEGAEKFPVLVSLTSSANQNSISSASAAFSRGYAVATVPYQQLGADASNWKSTGFFPAYPDYDWRDFSAWAWGLSRAVDYLVTDPVIDAEKIMITGVSRLGQAVLLAGAFDERIALSAPVAGGMAFRFSGKEMGGGLGQGITEVVDQNTYWFGPRLPEFRNQTPKLPSDQHWLPALTAPRLFILCNSLADQYGRAYAAVQTYLEAKPVYELLEAGDNLGLSFREGGHGMTAEDWSALLDFADQYLLKKGGDRRFDVIPPEEDLP